MDDDSVPDEEDPEPPDETLSAPEDILILNKGKARRLATYLALEYGRRLVWVRKLQI